ncbi:SCP2 sterol-binding domain-containing protein [Deinococcus sp.]|uniref:SCP2 sterol-binding domain-containing protein n=1 Tax=Deinococcus sp. TaxID=47478 RepID=UPI0025C617A3|nr:SCP2 sterol-binding domain-containing protein [Deinococcus sp.]
MQDVLQAVLERGQDTDTARGLAKAGLTVAFVYEGPSVRLVMDGKNPPVGQAIGFYFGDEAPTPDVTFSLNADVGHRFWAGNLNVPQALARGQIRAAGSIAKALKLLPLMPPLYESYRQVMTERGRAGELP